MDKGGKPDMSRGSRLVAGKVVLSILMLIFVWDVFFIVINEMLKAIDLKNLIQQYDPWFLAPAITFVTSMYSWMLTIVGNAVALVVLLVISYMYDLSEVEWT